MPVLYILAGPNGSGKTIYYTTALKEVFIQSRLSFLNIDLIVQQLGGISLANVARAEMVYRERISELINPKVIL